MGAIGVYWGLLGSIGVTYGHCVGTKFFVPKKTVFVPKINLFVRNCVQLCAIVCNFCSALNSLWGLILVGANWGFISAHGSD